MKLFLLLAATSLYAANDHQNIGNAGQHNPGMVQGPVVHNPTYTRLSPEERAYIANHIRTDKISEMAQNLGRAWSTIDREIKRNADWDGAYRAAEAQRKYMERQKRQG